MKHVTIKDVAKALNCSISTVSRAFNNKYDIHPDTREKILKMALEMGYSPNPIARKLTQQKTYNIGIVVPEFINPFFPEVIIGIQDVFLKKGYQTLIMQSNEDSNTELENIKTLENNFVDGIILSLSQKSQNIEYIQALIKKNYPIVLFNRINDSLPVSKVVFDDYKWAFFATEHLIQQGLKKIIHLTGPMQHNFAKNRAKGFEDAHRKYGIKISHEQFIETGLLIEDGEQIIEHLIKIKNLPDGIFAVNDPTALGAMRALKRNGIKIPQDIAIAGFSETPMAALVDPPLTSVLQPTTHMGEVAAELLYEQIISDSLAIPNTVVLSGKLNIRESSKRLK
ncbi:LacI family DNA-binding transcriptional regulator [Maribellus maritimus]|uniref:LacI family DNA-binding transcriptional regulator n=1 Tax=Maribellus maritimus TaxID=2870838 RepID=UPI001EEB2CF5|nr:LacI family DNA-binding transcriptional regulator [Maribellus maritimus]MCG6190481.1 LacI family transcriptional regulator [Maribellus maritimus]